MGSFVKYDARFLSKVWATGQRKIGECVIVVLFSVYMLSLSFLVSVFSFSNQKHCVTNPMSILYISPMTDKKLCIICWKFTALCLYLYIYIHIQYVHGHMKPTFFFSIGYPRAPNNYLSVMSLSIGAECRDYLIMGFWPHL